MKIHGLTDRKPAPLEQFAMWCIVNSGYIATDNGWEEDLIRNAKAALKSTADGRTMLRNYGKARR